MKLIGLISTTVLSLTLAAAVTMYAQEQHDQQEEKKDQPAEKKPQPEKAAKQEKKPAQHQDKNVKQEEKTSQQQNKNARQQEKPAQEQNKTAQHEAHPPQQHSSHAKPVQQAHGGGGRIPDDRFKAHFGQDHRFRVTQANYSSHRFQYGGYWFGFVDPWPSNWLYTQDVYVVDIDGVYYLCNAMYPGVNVALSVTL